MQVEVGDCHLGPQSGEPLGISPSKSPCRAGYDRHFPVELIHRSLLSSNILARLSSLVCWPDQCSDRMISRPTTCGVMRDLVACHDRPNRQTIALANWRTS